jgi:hypothetical protein
MENVTLIEVCLCPAPVERFATAVVAKRSHAGLAPAHDLAASVAVAVGGRPIAVAGVPAGVALGIELVHLRLLVGG